MNRPGGDSCFSIYQISWIKILKKVNKRRHFVQSLFTFQLKVFRGSFFYDFVANSVGNFFFYRPVNTDKPNFVSFLVFVGAAASFIAKISSFENVLKREAILNPVPKQ